MAPVIGITCSLEESVGRYFLGRDYAAAIRKAGGIPVILPAGGTPGEVLDVLDGLLLSGGGDLDPFFFGQETLPCTGEIDPERDAFEVELTRLALDRELPLLGICRGMQVLNVAAGGTVCQDLSLKIDYPLKHIQQAPRWHPTHEIEVGKGTLAARALGAGSLRVNSFHHQVIRDVAPGFTVSARAADGVEEIIECSLPGVYVLGVQFHPENMWRHNPLFLTLFSYLVRHSFQKESKGGQRIF